MGLDPLPAYTPPYESPERVPELAARYPLMLISSPAHQFLNSTFVNVDALRRGARQPECLLHPDDAERRGIVGRHARGRAQRPRRRSPPWRAWRIPSARGVVWAPSIWWSKLAADGANANQTTSQRETDMGHGPVFYDNRVEVFPAD